jgi:hypothetical protein
VVWNGAQRAWEEFLEILVCRMVGYGIFMRGANMHCRENQVFAKTACGGTSSKQANRKQNTIKKENYLVAYPTLSSRALPLSGSAIGGIWHFSNFYGFALDVLRMLPVDRKANRNPYKMMVGLLNFILLSREKNRFLSDTGNTVDDAAFHGIRSIGVFGLRDLDVFDNTVRDAIRHGIVHAGLLDSNVVAKVHRNTVLKTKSDNLLRTLAEYLGIFSNGFSNLMRIGNEEGTVLMMNNHGDATAQGQENPAGVYIVTYGMGVQGNHILTNGEFGFRIIAKKGLFTDNFTSKPNDIKPPALKHPPNVEDI